MNRTSSGKMLKTCPVCGGVELAEARVLRTPDRFEKSVGVAISGYKRVWLECRACNFGVNLLPDQSEQLLGRLGISYYHVDFNGAPLSEKYNKVMNLPPHESDNAARVQRIINFLARSQLASEVPVVLDIGAGLGVFLSKLLSSFPGDINCLAIEPDPLAARHLRELGLFEVVEKTVDTAENLGFFSLITLNKVLEHINRPTELLGSVTRLMDPKGSTVYIEVPDVLNLRVKQDLDNSLGPLHKHLYSPSSLIQMLSSVGLDVLELARVREPSGKLTLYAFACGKDSSAHGDFPLTAPRS